MNRPPQFLQCRPLILAQRRKVLINRTRSFLHFAWFSAIRAFKIFFTIATGGGFYG